MSKTKQTIAIDVDDVLVPTTDAMREFVNKTFGTNLTEEDYKQPGPYRQYFEHVWQVTPEEGLRRYNSFIEAGELVRAQPVKDAIEVIAELEKKYNLVIVSARGDKQMEMTHQWLDAHFPEVFKGVHFQSAWYNDPTKTKAAICKEIGADYLIDDNSEHCFLAQKEGITALLFGDYGYNNDEMSKGLKRVLNWQEVKEYFNE